MHLFIIKKVFLFRTKKCNLEGCLIEREKNRFNFLGFLQQVKRNDKFLSKKTLIATSV